MGVQLKTKPPFDTRTFPLHVELHLQSFAFAPHFNPSMFNPKTNFIFSLIIQEG
jgi:hypothetical protein